MENMNRENLNKLIENLEQCETFNMGHNKTCLMQFIPSDNFEPWDTLARYLNISIGEASALYVGRDAKNNKIVYGMFPTKNHNEIQKQKMLAYLRSL